MNSISRDERKRKGFGRFLRSFSYSVEGLRYTIRYEQSILVMFIAAFIAVLLGIGLKISISEWIFVFLAIGIVLGIELINTSIEAAVDLISPGIHPLAKIAKDTSSAAVFVFSVISFIIGCFIFIPKIMTIVEMGW